MDERIDIRDVVTRVVAQTPVTDLHTHLYAPEFGPLLLWGIDELLTYHYLAAEVLRVSNVGSDAYWAMGKREQASLVWHELFLERSPIGEACRGVLTALDALGLDVASRDLDEYRDYFSTQRLAAHLDTVFQRANLSSVVMTNDPFDPVERAVWDREFAGDRRFHAALRIDPLLNDWGNTCKALKGSGCDVEPSLNTKTLAEVRRFLAQWLKRMNALYMAVSLPPSFRLPEESPRATLIEECVLPVAREHGVPFALMVGVKRNVNPALRQAADGVGISAVDAVCWLCANFPDNKFMVTMLARENQHELCVLTRKFRNLHPFGCWWFTNVPHLIDEITRLRLELLGLSFTPQHSDARVLDQIVYKWQHSRGIIAQALTDKYADLAKTGWQATRAEIERDVKDLFGGAFTRFCQS
jgi:hypothetical protein